jgi:hypothetical protein
MTLDALYHLDDIGTGDTRPQVFMCDRDGVHEPWVLKLAGLSASELAADWIGSRLAHRLGLRSPVVALASVSPAALLSAPPDIQAWARPGPAFASKLVASATAGLTDTDLARMPAADLGAMYALDAWLEVLDRRKPDGIWNALRDGGDGGLVVLDFGKSLSPCLQVLFGAGDELVEPDYPTDVRQAADVSAALRVCATIEVMPRAEVEQIVASVPGEWLADALRPRVARFLMERAGRVRELCLRALGGEA